ncbi:hypothetical protein J7E70_24510 [Variovorax paradoxus]|nr:hypothetical protein [Variovorax paradoxus]MBT2303615.1 hypothetical protein [Variovorax paradoxus]
MNPRNMLAGLGLVAAVCAMPAVAADEHGHDHGASAAASGPALPRFSAVSEVFELVGVVDGKQLTVYLDRFGDNAPVKDAKVELEIGGARVALQQHAEGEYEGALAQELKPGVIAVTASIVAGKDADLLAGELDLHEEAAAHDSPARGWRPYAAWAAGAVVVLAALAWFRRRAVGAQRARMGGEA